MAWTFCRQSIPRKRSLDELAANQLELARLLLELGYNPQKVFKARRILADLKTTSKTKISDFAVFQKRLNLAAQSVTVEPRSTELDRQFFEQLLRAIEDQETTLAILDRDPVGQRIPFVELVPVKKGSGTAWLAPVDQSIVVKRPADAIRFLELLSQFADLFRDPDPAIQDELRLNLIDAVRRVRREVDREGSYLLSAIQLLESRLNMYETSGQEPSCRNLLEFVRAIIEDVESARVQMPASVASRGQLRNAVERYLTHPKPWSRWLTNYLVENLLAPAQVENAALSSARSRKTVEMIRCEVAGGKYSAPEIMRRLRDLERTGLYFSSMVYELLAHNNGRTASRSPKRRTSAEAF